MSTRAGDRGAQPPDVKTAKPAARERQRAMGAEGAAAGLWADAPRFTPEG